MKKKMQLAVFCVFIALMSIKAQPNVRHKIIKTIKKDLRHEYEYSIKKTRSIIKDITIIPVYKRRLDAKRIDKYTLDQSIISYLKPYNRKIRFAYIYKTDSLIGVCSYGIFKQNRGAFSYFIDSYYKYKEGYQQDSEYLLSRFNGSTLFFTIAELRFSIWIDDGENVMVYDTEDKKVYTPEEFIEKYHNNNVDGIKKMAKRKYPEGGGVIILD